MARGKEKKITMSLEKYVKSLKISREEIAEKLGITRQYLSQLMRGHDPKHSMARKIVAFSNNIVTHEELEKAYVLKKKQSEESNGNDDGANG
jgi:transcriptional regulator with XRE-family HTH domain